MIVNIVMFSWPLVVLMMFAQRPRRRAVIWSMVIAWLFLPIADLKVPGIPDYSKMSATCYGVVLGIVLFDFNAILSFRWRWIDLPVLIWCVCPGISSLANDLGPYDAASAIMYQTVTWGIPYLIGRMYFPDADSLRELALAIVIGGLIYVPLCLFEIRMSPSLHLWVYGYHQHDFGQEIRYGGFRPTVFMNHGLMVGMWMCMTTLIAGWLLWNRRLPKVLGLPASVQVLLLAGTAVLCKSTGAIVLLMAGAAALLITTMFETRVALICLIIAAPLYVMLRCSGEWDGQSLVSLSATQGADRSQSLDFRLHNENMLMAKALKQPIFGWGGWGRSRVYDETGKDISITDGLWIIALGNFGIVGLASLTVFLLLPALRMLWHYPPRVWHVNPEFAAPAVCCVVTTLYMIDNIPNGMINPIFTLIAGALCGMKPLTAQQKPIVVERRFSSERPSFHASTLAN